MMNNEETEELQHSKTFHTTLECTFFHTGSACLSIIYGRTSIFISFRVVVISVVHRSYSWSTSYEGRLE